MSSVKEIVEIAQGIATIVAIIAAGLWGLYVFQKRRQQYPRANVTHHVSHYPLADNKTLMHVAVTIANVGEALVQVISQDVRLQLVHPIPPEVASSLEDLENMSAAGGSTIGAEIEWPEIDSKSMRLEKKLVEIEPGETDQIHYDFVIDSTVETVEVYSYSKNIYKPGREIGWAHTSIYNMTTQLAVS